jgi:CRISPR-associated protein Csh1
LRGGLDLIENIIQLGDIILGSAGFLDAMISKVEPLTRKGEQRYVCKFMFDTSKQEIAFDLNEEISNDTSKKYMFVGTIGGPNSPQWCTTVKTPDYFLTETIPTLLKQDIPEEYRTKIQNVLDTMYTNVEGTEGKYKYFLNIEKAGMGEKIEDVFEKLRDDSKKTNKQVQKSARSEVSKIFYNYIKEKYGYKKDLIGLCVLYIDGECISTSGFYIDLLESSLQSGKGSTDGPPKKKSPARSFKSSCRLCGSCEDVDFKLKKSKIKYYITDKINFASDIDEKNFYRNFSLCSQCYQKLQTGEVYVKDYLKTRLSQFDIYLLPHFIFKTHMNKQQLDECSEMLKRAVGRICSFDEIIEFRDKLYNINVYDDPYLIDFVFFEASNQATKIKKVIKDLEPSVFDDIQMNLVTVNDGYKAYYGKYGFDMRSFFYLLPSIKGNDGKYSARLKQLLEWYVAIFTGRSIDVKSIIENSINRARQMVVKNEEFDMMDTIIKANMAIYFLELSGCIKKQSRRGGCEIVIDLKPEIKDFIEKAGYDEEKTGLFLLGALIAEIAYAQYKSDEKKPILNKINYWGMDRTKVISLANEVFNKLRQEKILHFSEKLYGECMRLIGKSALNLPKKEMLFYILTGYSVTTTCNIKEAQASKKLSDS